MGLVICVLLGRGVEGRKPQVKSGMRGRHEERAGVSSGPSMQVDIFANVPRSLSWEISRRLFPTILLAVNSIKFFKSKKIF